MSEFRPVATKADLSVLDEDEMVAGYRAGRRGDSEPGSAFSRSYWHGWRNGMTDSGRKMIDDAQMQLAKDVVARHMRLH